MRKCLTAFYMGLSNKQTLKSLSHISEHTLPSGTLTKISQLIHPKVKRKMSVFSGYHCGVLDQMLYQNKLLEQEIKHMPKRFRNKKDIFDEEVNRTNRIIKA